MVVGKFLLKNKSQTSKSLGVVFKQPVVPKLAIACVSVDSVVLAHLMSLKRPNISRGKRYILCEGTYWVKDIFSIMEEEFGQYGYKFAQYYPPYLSIKILSCFSEEYRFAEKFWGLRNIYDSSLVKKDLDIPFRFHRTYWIECFNSLIEQGLIPDKIKGRKLI